MPKVRFGIPQIDEGVAMELTVMNSQGIPVYIYPNKALHSFAIGLYIRMGSLFESASENGITHFLEHLAVRNVNFMRRGGLYSQLDRLGLTLEAATYKEFVCFSIEGSPEHFADAAEILSDMVSPLVLDKSEIGLERGRVRAENREADEKSTLDYFSLPYIWGKTPTAQTILGSAGNISSFTVKRLNDAHDKMFSCENVFGYITGYAEPSDAELFAQMLGKYTLSSYPLRQNISVVPSEMFSRGVTVAVKNSSATVVRFSVDVDTSRYSDAEMTLFSALLFDGERSLIQQELSEKTGFIYSFDVVNEKYNNVGNLNFKYEIKPSLLQKSLEIVLGIFAKLKKGMDTSLECVIAPYTDNALFICDDAVNFNWLRAYECHILGEKYASVTERAKRYASVTSEDMRKMACELFVPDNIVVTIKGDRKKINADAIKSLVTDYLG